LDITDVRSADLSPLSDNTKLVELGIGSGQIPGLLALTHLQNLAKLRIISQGNVDLGPVGALPNLQDLWVWAGVSRFDLRPLRNLTQLRKLALAVLGMGRLAPVDNIDAIGHLKELQSLTLSDLQVTDLLFVENLDHLQELNLNGTPISSLDPLRGLKELKTISINALPISDISALLDLPELAELRIMRTPARADILVALERRGVKVQSN
jgi:internalin A